jgi:hypothetical protein
MLNELQPATQLMKNYKGMYKLVKEVNKLKKQNNKPRGIIKAKEKGTE